MIPFIVGALAAVLYVPAASSGATAPTVAADTGRDLDGALLTGLLGLLAIVIVIAAAELALRRLARRPGDGASDPENPKPRALSVQDAHTLYERVLFGVAPAVVAAVITALRSDSIAPGVVVFVAVSATVAFLGSRRHPLHLMPVARYAVGAVAPALGLGLALSLNLVSDFDLRGGTALAALVAAWSIMLLGVWLEAGFASERPVRLAVIGPAALAEQLASEMAETRIRGYRVVGFLSDPGSASPVEATRVGLPWLGELADVRRIVQANAIDLLAVGPDTPRLQVFEETATACLDLPVRMIEVSALYEEVLGHVPIGAINAAWFQCIMHPRYSPTSPLSKRALDLMIALPAATLALPIVPVLAAAVKLADGGPAFYRQRRVGEQGREFDIVKLRTMRLDAHELAGKVPKSELITPIGRVLRKTHLDELPQLFGVVKGDMTLVGPRPEQPLLVEQLSRLVPYYERRSLVKPGMTGWAQVRCGYAGTEVGTAWKLCHDLYYVKRRSIAFDLLILVQTLHTLFEGADEELPTPAEDFILGERISAPSAERATVAR